MSSRSVLAMRARGPLETELPLRSYFLKVGGALLLLLLAADWVLPPPPPSRLTQSHPALPPIRIHSDRKGPEAALIDTSRPVQVISDAAVTAAQPPSFDLALATEPPASPALTEDARKGPASLTASPTGEILPHAIADQPPGRTRGQTAAEPRERFDHGPSGKRPSARLRSTGAPGWCRSSRNGCRYALVPHRARQTTRPL